MAVQSPPAYLQASSHGAELFRRALNSLIVGTGVIGGTDLKVTQNTGTDLKCQVAAGQLWIPGTLGSATGMRANASVQGSYSPTSATFTSQGSYYGFNDAAITALSFAAANVTNPRIDLVVATVNDAGYAGATNNWVVQVITGTAAGSPVAPAIPANSVVLAQVAIAANATAVVNANITDQRLFVSAGRRSALVKSDFTNAGESTTSTTATALTTPGPIVNTTILDSGACLVHLYCSVLPATNDYATMGFELSGANTLATTRSRSIYIGNSGNPQVGAGATFHLTGLSAGLTTFTAKYNSSFGGTATFTDRKMIVEVLP